MNNSTLKTLLKEYEQKRLSALLDLDRRKEKLYASSPRLQEIDTELNHFALNTAKSILTSNNSTNSLEELKKKIDCLKAEKQKILDSLHLDDSFFKPNFSCSKCEDTGFVNVDNHYELCNCIKQKLFDMEYNKSNISDLKNHNFEHFNFDLYSDKINENLYNSNISPRDNIKNIKDIADSFIQNFDNPEEKNLLFAGNTGLRKILFIRLYCLRIIKTRKNRTLPDCTCYA
ncbi:MAG: hypothetical protein J6A04_06085 [Clostridia bacterium]|nr:hypothetical protein [Clostridia bacterium]